MNLALIATGGLLGLAAIPHCALMCGAPCAALVGRGRTSSAGIAFLAGRAIGYGAAGALAAGAVGLLSLAGREAKLIQSAWTMLHAIALVFGLWLLIRGRAPELVSPLGRLPSSTRSKRIAGAAIAGMMWVGWPCGVLQAAIAVAALGFDPLGGAMTMIAYAAASSLGLAVGPAVWRRLGGRRVRVRSWAARGAGALLVLSSAWVLVHPAAPAAAPWCWSA